MYRWSCWNERSRCTATGRYGCRISQIATLRFAEFRILFKSRTSPSSRSIEYFCILGTSSIESSFPRADRTPQLPFHGSAAHDPPRLWLRRALFLCLARALIVISLTPYTVYTASLAPVFRMAQMVPSDDGDERGSLAWTCSVVNHLHPRSQVEPHGARVDLTIHT